MAENPRIEELRRRVERDPASIAFAQLAEEYRRAGNYADAIDTCRTGLATHPSYLSARITLGRSLIEVNELQDAEVELRYVLQYAPENLAAIRGLADVYRLRGDHGQALAFYQAALRIARHDPDLEQAVNDLLRTVKPIAAPESDGLSFEQVSAEFLDSFAPPVVESEVPIIAKNPALPALQRFLGTIQNYRQRKAV